MTSYDVEQVLERINNSSELSLSLYCLALIVLSSSMLVLIISMFRTKADTFNTPVMFGLPLIVLLSIFTLMNSPQQSSKLQDLTRLQDNNVNFCYGNTLIDLDDIEQSSSNSNSKHCRHWTDYTNFYWDSGSVHITTNDPEVDKMLNSCIEGSATKQSTASGSAVDGNPKQQSKSGGKKND